MKQHIRLTLNTIGIALLLTIIKWLIDIYLVMNGRVEFSDFVVSASSGYVSLGIATFIVSAWKGHQNAWLTTYLYYWLVLVLFNQSLIYAAYQHSPLTLIVLLLVTPLSGFIFALIGGLLGKIIRKIIFNNNSNQVSLESQSENA